MTRHLADRLAGSPELAAAVTPALLGTDPDVERLRLRIGGEFVDRFRAALGTDADPAVARDRSRWRSPVRCCRAGWA